MKKVCEDASFARKEYGQLMAKRIHERIDQLIAAESVEELIKFKIGGCHQLKGDRSHQYALDLEQPYRLIIEKKGQEVQIVKIVEITNYH